MEWQLGHPFFTWNDNSYWFVPSVAEFKRDLDTGGFVIVKMMTSTVRRFNRDGTNVFDSIALPTAQQKITYNVDNLEYRIESIRTDPSLSYFRMIAVGTARGI